MTKDKLMTYCVVMNDGEQKVVVSTDEVIEQMKDAKQIRGVQSVNIATEADKSGLVHFSQVMEDN